MRPFSCTCRAKARLVGKTVLITGANTGLGKETARDLYRRGARVILACRDIAKANAAVEELKAIPPSKPDRKHFNGDPGELAVCHLNLSSFASIRECAKTLTKTEANIHLLINNAGVIGCPFEKTEDGFELVLQTNYLGHFLLTLLLLPKLKSSAPGVRIINVSSIAHYCGKTAEHRLTGLFINYKLFIYHIDSVGNIYFDDLNLETSYSQRKAYCQSKLANVLFTKELARRLNEARIDGISVYALHPGAVLTEAYRHWDTAFFRKIKTIVRLTIKPFVKTPELGAQTTLHCAVDEEAGKQTGLYYKECSVTNPSSKARNGELAVRLWEETVKLVGLTPQDNLAEMLSTISRIVSSSNETSRIEDRLKDE